jgi:hypothetical protein
MKKVIGILSMVVLTVVFGSHTALTHNALHPFIPTECSGSASTQITDISEEGLITSEDGTISHLTPADYLPGDLCPHTSLGINSFVWQPPE